MVYCLAAFLSRNYFSILSPTSRDQEEKSLFVNPTLAFRPLFESVWFSSSVVSDSLRPHGLQHTRLPCPSPTLKAFSNLCPLSRWCHPTISSPVVPFSCPQSFPASGSFPVSQFFASGRVSASTSVLPVNIQDWLSLGLTGLISLQSKGLSRVFSSTTVQSINSLALRFLALLLKNPPAIVWLTLVKMAFPLMFLASISCLSFFLPVTDIQNIPQWSLRTFTSVSGFLYFLSFPIILTDHTIHILDSSNTLAICLFYLNSGILHLYSKPFHLAVVWRPCHLLEPVISDTYFFFPSFHPVFTEDNETDSSCTLKKNSSSLLDWFPCCHSAWKLCPLSHRALTCTWAKDPGYEFFPLPTENSCIFIHPLLPFY